MGKAMPGKNYEIFLFEMKSLALYMSDCDKVWWLESAQETWVSDGSHAEQQGVFKVTLKHQTQQEWSQLLWLLLQKSTDP